MHQQKQVPGLAKCRDNYARVAAEYEDASWGKSGENSLSCAGLPDLRD
jgi:hypothetical protein